MSIKQSILYNEPLEQIEGSEIMSARGGRKKSMIPQITEEIKENRIVILNIATQHTMTCHFGLSHAVFVCTHIHACTHA